MTLFNGLSAFPLTPTDESGRLLLEPLHNALERIVTAKVDSIGLLGSTGGYAYLSEQERKRVLKVAVDCVAGRLPLIVGVGALTTQATLDLAKDAMVTGADGLLLAPMSYQPLTQEEVFQHFKAVSEVGLPLCIYNNPGTTKFSFSHELIARISELPNVAAVKMPLPMDGDFGGELTKLRSMVPNHFAIGYSGDWGAKEALLSGADSWFSVIAGLLPEQALALARAAQSRNQPEAERIDRVFAPMWSLFKEFGSYRVMFTIADCLGLGTFSSPRPILPLAPQNYERVQEALLPILKLTP